MCGQIGKSVFGCFFFIMKSDWLEVNLKSFLLTKLCLEALDQFWTYAIPGTAVNRTGLHGNQTEVAIVTVRCLHHQTTDSATTCHTYVHT